MQKPVELDEALLLVERARERSLLLSENAMSPRAARRALLSFDTIVSQSGEMDAVLNTAGRVARSKASVLIRGESGTGKELIARAIHHASPRRDAPFVTINCAALPDALLESEVVRAREGRLHRRNGSASAASSRPTAARCSIDEVGDIPARRAGRSCCGRCNSGDRARGRQRDARWTCASWPRRTGIRSHDAGRRLPRGSVLSPERRLGIHIPPLRARRADIPPLVDAFAQACRANGREALRPVSREAMDLLLRHDYPGNVRELDNILQHAVVLARRHHHHAGSARLRAVPARERRPQRRRDLRRTRESERARGTAGGA
ncbi:MAG: sigma-54-dependent Fis family transcriptional regulator [Ignavibacteria bacterium]|nr:sigma-54-dependent Fis family transcriptional regulator [Ignavibacteria bacterium]